MIRRFRIVPDVPTTLIPNGVDREKFRPDPERRAAFREKYRIGEDERVVLTVAQQTPRKGIYDFLSLSHKHPDIRFIWVGGFPYGRFSQDHSRIEEKKSQAGRNVLFTGFVDDIASAYCGADLFFFPSYAEGLPIVILEALATGLAVVARRIPSSPGISGTPSCTSTASRKRACYLRTRTYSDVMRRSPGHSRRGLISGRLRTAMLTCTELAG